MKKEYIDPFILVTENFFEKIMNIKAEPGQPYTKDDTHPSHPFDISSIIGIMGDLLGVIAISFTKKGALKIPEAFTGQKAFDIDHITVDAICEVINIIAGNVKKQFSTLTLNIALPSVIVGPNHMILCPASIETVIVPFNSTLGEFALSISIMETPNNIL